MDVKILSMTQGDGTAKRLVQSIVRCRTFHSYIWLMRAMDRLVSSLMCLSALSCEYTTDRNFLASSSEQPLKGTVTTFSVEALARRPPSPNILAKTGMRRARNSECAGSSLPSSSLSRTFQVCRKARERYHSSGSIRNGSVEAMRPEVAYAACASKQSSFGRFTSKLLGKTFTERLCMLLTECGRIWPASLRGSGQLDSRLSKRGSCTAYMALID